MFSVAVTFLSMKLVQNAKGAIPSDKTDWPQVIIFSGNFIYMITGYFASLHLYWEFYFP